jgi:hypothetical protein
MSDTAVDDNDDVNAPPHSHVAISDAPPPDKSSDDDEPEPKKRPDVKPVFDNGKDAGRAISDPDPRVRAAAHDYFEQQYDNDRQFQASQQANPATRWPQFYGNQSTTPEPAKPYIPPSVQQARQAANQPVPTQPGNTPPSPAGPPTPTADTTEGPSGAPQGAVDAGKPPAAPSTLPDERTTQGEGTEGPTGSEALQPTEGGDYSDESNAPNPEALHAGLGALNQEYNLDGKGSAVPDPQQHADNQRRAMTDTPDYSDVKAAFKAVDPDGRLGHAQAVLRVMNKGYEYYMSHGDSVRAANFAAQMMQYANHEASLYGNKAILDLKKGDNEEAAHNLTNAAQNYLGGKSASVRANPNGTFTVMEIDDADNKAVGKHVLNGQQLFQLATGTANGTEVWNGLMQAAANRPGQKGITQADTAALTSLQNRIQASQAGAGAAGGASAGQAAPAAGAAPAPQGQAVDPNAPAPVPQAPQAQPIPNQPVGAGQAPGQLIARADPAAMYLVESANNPNAVSPKGAIGIAQTMPGTLANPGFGVRPADPAKLANPATRNAELQRVGDDYLAAMQNKYKNPTLATIAYNWGPANTDAWLARGGNPNQLPPETRQYLARIAVAQANQGRQPPVTPQGNQPTSPFQMGQMEQRDIGPTAPTRQFAPLAAPIEESPEETKGLSPSGIALYKDTVRTANVEAQRVQKAQQAIFDKEYAANRDKFVQDTKDFKEQLAGGKAVNSDAAWKAAQQAKADMVTDKNSDDGKVYNTLQPRTKQAVDSIAAQFKMLNPSMTPNALYTAAIQMVRPPADGQRAPFRLTPTKNPNVVRVHFGNSSYLLPSDATDDASAVMGNEHYLQRMARAKAAPPSQLGPKAVAAGQGVANIAANAAAPAARAGVDIANAGAGAVAGAVDALGRPIYNYLNRGPNQNNQPTIVTPGA